MALDSVWDKANGLHLPLCSSLQISAVRAIVPNRSNNEIVLVLQHFDNCVDKTVQAFMEGNCGWFLDGVCGFVTCLYCVYGPTSEAAMGCVQQVHQGAEACVASQQVQVQALPTKITKGMILFPSSGWCLFN